MITKKRGQRINVIQILPVYSTHNTIHRRINRISIAYCASTKSTMLKLLLPIKSCGKLFSKLAWTTRPVDQVQKNNLHTAILHLDNNLRLMHSSSKFFKAIFVLEQIRINW